MARHCVDYLKSLGQPAIQVSFATPIKAMLSALGLSNEQLNGSQKEVLDPRFGRTPRYLMQTLGTEWGRGLVREDLWPSMALDSGLDIVKVVDDMRFANELAAVRDRCGVVVRCNSAIRTLPRGAAAHRSEASGVDLWQVDMDLDNDDPVEENWLRIRWFVDDEIKKITERDRQCIHGQTSIDISRVHQIL
jgi:hypothetical protein